MKTKHFLLALMLTVALVACSDGVPPDNVNPDVVSAAKQRQDNAAAESQLPAPRFINLVVTPEVVPMDGTVTLSWSVQEATRVEVKMRYEDDTTEKLDSYGSEAQEIKVKNLRKNVTFEFSAIKDLAAAASEEKESSEEKSMTAGEEEEEVSEEEKIEQKSSDPEQTVGPCTKEMTSCVTTAKRTVIVIGSTPVEVECYAQETEIELGESTMIFWETKPQEGTTVQISASPEGDPIQLTDCEAESMDAAIVEGELVDDMTLGYPAKGCAVVRPDTSTTYTINAINENYQPSSCTVDVGIEGEIAGPIPQPPLLSIEDFSANGDSDGEYSVNNFPANGVVISWRALPASATVTMTADPAGNVTVENGSLPTDGASEGSVSVNVTGDVRLTLTAHGAGESVAVKTINIISSGMRAGGTFDSTKVTFNFPQTPFLFAGESVPVSWSVDPSFASKITKVKLIDPAGNKIAEGGATGEATITGSISGSYSLQLESGGQVVPMDKPITQSLQVVSLKKETSGTITRVTNSPVYIGYDQGSYKDKEDVSIKISKEDGKGDYVDMDPIPLMGLLSPALTGAAGANPAFFTQAVQTYPVNALAVIPNEPTKVAVGTTGALLLVTEGKPTLITPIEVYGPNYLGFHPTCFGKTQTGVKPYHKDELVSLGQVCDISINDDGRIFVATDIGLFHRDNIESQEPWYVAGFEDKSAFYQSLTNDTEIAEISGKKIVLAGGTAGVWYLDLSTQNTWSPLGTGLNGTVYTLATSKDGKLFAGTDSGLYSCSTTDLVSCSWQKSSGELANTIYTVKVDARDSNLVCVGTSEGFSISRNGGTSFSSLISGEEMAVRSISSGYTKSEDNGTETFGIFIGTGSGMLAGSAKVTASTTDTPSETPATEEQPASNAELTVSGSVTQ